MQTPRAAIDLTDQSSSEKLSETALPEAFYPIHIRPGRDEALLLFLIDYLTQKMIISGSAFPPCLEDLLYLLGGDYKRTELTFQTLKRKGLLKAFEVEMNGGMKCRIPKVLKISQKGFEHLHALKKENLVDLNEEWAQLAPRIQRLLVNPKIHIFDQPEISFFQIREIIRLITRFLPPISSLDSEIIARIAALVQNEALSPNEAYQKITAFVDFLLRFQGDYFPYNSLLEIAKLLEKHGIVVDLNKKNLYPHIQLFRTTGFFDLGEISEDVLFYKAAIKAINYYCELFRIEDRVKSQFFSLHGHLMHLEMISMDDPEAWALGIMGVIIDGFFSIEKHEQFPLLPGIWLAGKEQMKSIQKLLQKLSWQKRKNWQR